MDSGDNFFSALNREKKTTYLVCGNSAWIRLLTVLNLGTKYTGGVFIVDIFGVIQDFLSVIDRHREGFTRGYTQFVNNLWSIRVQLLLNHLYILLQF